MPSGVERAVRIGFGALVAGSTVTAMAVLGVTPWALLTWVDPAFEVFGRKIPPDFDALGVELFDAALQTVAIALVATAVGRCCRSRWESCSPAP